MNNKKDIGRDSKGCFTKGHLGFNHNLGVRTVAWEKIVCKVCGKLFEDRVSYNRKFCSLECSFKGRKSKYGIKINKGYNKSYYRIYGKRYRKTYFKSMKNKYGIGAGTIQRYGFKLALKIYDKFDRKCKQCGGENDLTIHHIDHNGRNLENKGLKPNNSEENLILICRSCHGKIHGGEHGKNKRKE